MAFHLVDVRMRGVKTFKNAEFYLNFRNERRVFDFELDEKILTPLSGTNYRQHVIAVAGINASGKTSVLNLCHFIFKVFWEGEGVNAARKLPVFVPDATLLFKSTVFIELHFTDTHKLYRLTSTLKFDERRKGYVFREEILLSKNLKSRENKTDFLNFKGVSGQEVILRSTLKPAARTFLKDDVSMITGLLDICEAPDFIQSMLPQTNLNPVPDIPETDLLGEMLRYLDPSIERLTPLNPEAPSDTRRYELKFQGQSPMTVNADQLDSYLSAGTLKGLDLYGRALDVLQNGGYLLVDDLENHLNKIVAEKFINLFQSEANVNGATLVFSTHYPEILDNILRMDAIQVLRKSAGGIAMDSLAALAKTAGKDRKDVKNSDLILSGLFGTASSYEDYWALHKKIIDQIKQL